MKFLWRGNSICVCQLLYCISLYNFSKSAAQFHLSQKVSFDTAAAYEFLDKMQQPTSGCNGNEYSIIHPGRFGGGFASQFQMAAKDWLTAAAGHDYKVPILIRGHIRGYSDGEECLHVEKDWTCLFLPTSSCQDVLLSTGKHIEHSNRTKSAADASMVPSQFAEKGYAWWWGIVQARMFRMQPIVEEYIKFEINHMKGMNAGRGFPFGSPIAGLHVRHGDKSTDGFQDHSFEAELRAIEKSPECEKVSETYCLTNFNAKPTNITRNRLLSDISNIDNTSEVNMKSSDSVYHYTRLNKTKGHYSSGRISIYVASDDAKVLVLAKEKGHLVDSSGSGLSQQTANEGMFKTLNSNPALGFNASLEIMTDMFFLSRCTTLIGIGASQVFRVAVGISNATGLLRAAIVMDYDQMAKIKMLSLRYDVPVPEIDSFIDARS